MPTFSELQARLVSLQHRKSILTYLIEHLDANFMPMSGADPKKQLLGDDRLPIPTDAFELVLDDVLSAESQQLDQEINGILALDVNQAKTGDEPPKPVEKVRKKRAHKEQGSDRTTGQRAGDEAAIQARSEEATNLP